MLSTQPFNKKTLFLEKKKLAYPIYIRIEIDYNYKTRRIYEHISPSQIAKNKTNIQYYQCRFMVLQDWYQVFSETLWNRNGFLVTHFVLRYKTGSTYNCNLDGLRQKIFEKIKHIESVLFVETYYYNLRCNKHWDFKCAQIIRLQV